MRKQSGIRRRVVVGACLAGIFLSLTVVVICDKHYLRYSACYRIPTEHTGFYPDAYLFIHSEPEFRRCMELIDDDGLPEADSLISKNRLDFDRHTYLLVFGARIKKIYYSYKSTWWDDQSPSYARAWKTGKKCVSVEYESPDSQLYLYRLDRDTTLRGFDGI